MRRVIATPQKTNPDAPTDSTQLQPVEGADLSGFYWVTSGWIRGNPSCSAAAEETRLRGCVYQGNQANEANCPAPAPEISRVVEDYRACKYQWTVVSTGDWAESCAQTTRPVTAECVRETGETVSDENCAGATKPAEMSGFNEEGCTYSWGIGEWGNWKSQCSPETSRERKVECIRSSGGVASDDRCEEPKPDDAEIGENYSNCEYRWVPTSWQSEEQSCGGEVRQTRTVTCQRTDGLEADPELCLDPVPALEQTAPDYSACSYTWKADDWGPWSSQCSANSRRTRNVYCEREDGKSVQGASCGAGEPASEETAEILTNCGYEWQTGSWSTVPQCSASAETTRSVTCHRTDGAEVDEVLCDSATKPASSKATGDYTGCTYSWKTSLTQWNSTCSDAATGTRTVKCQRSDGTDAADEKCVIADKPDTTLIQAIYDGCSADWAVGEWSDWSSYCSSASKRTRAVQCVQERPSQAVVVPADKCDLTEQPFKEEQSAIYSSCQPYWHEGPWGWQGIEGSKSSTCSAAPQQNHSVVCKKISATGEVETLSDDQCGTKPATTRTLPSDYSGCGYQWVSGEWSDWDSTCSQTARRTRTVECHRTDGTLSAGSYCLETEPKPKTEEIAPNVTECGGKLQNNGFEDDLNHWSFLGNSTATTVSVSTDSAVGNKALKIEMGYYQSRYGQQIGDIPPNGTMSVTLRCKSNVNNMALKIRFGNGSSFSTPSEVRCPSGSYGQRSVEIRNTSINPIPDAWIVFEPTAYRHFWIDDVIAE